MKLRANKWEGRGFLTRQGSHEILLGDLLADGIQHLRVVADVVELGVVLDVSDIDGTAVGLSVVSCGSVPLESDVSLGADGQDVGGIEGTEVVAITDIGARFEDSVGGAQLEELGSGRHWIAFCSSSIPEYVHIS